ncbi:MAG: tRNA uridine-5-carboxymethylaminomethyl(34) synthesis GTPase MnmE [Chitinophagales bacterium]
MTHKLSGWDDTIVALATPPGISAIGMIRLSGPKSIGIIRELFPSKDLQHQPTHSLHFGRFQDGDLVIDEVVVSLFRAPRSYTGEDLVEISCHGSPFVLEQAIQACIRHGARLARPGEFTQKAFLHGKLDLVQAEAVADLIASQSEAARNAALNHMRGGFSHELSSLRERLLGFSSLIELELDFSQEDVEFANRKQFYYLLDEAEKTTKRLLESFRLGNAIRQGVQVAIIGKPNAGKSTLLNALLNENRAIVSEIPGTTRDTIEELINIDGILFRLIDTAGIRQHSSDQIESMGIEKTFEKIRQADLVIGLFDVSAEPSNGSGLFPDLAATEADRNKFIFVGNKTDLLSEQIAREKFPQWPEAIYLSARNQKVDSLKQALVDHVLEGRSNAEGTLVTNTRHYEALQQVELSLRDIRKGLDQALPGDLLSPDIRSCLHWLGEITGEITTEDQLDYIFSKFCIGK